jgi:hypothetical protein
MNLGLGWCGKCGVSTVFTENLTEKRIAPVRLQKIKIQEKQTEFLLNNG